jgi:hypothetical protein
MPQVSRRQSNLATPTARVGSAVGSDKKEKGVKKRKLERATGSQVSRRQSDSPQSTVGLGTVMEKVQPPQVSRRQSDLATSAAGVGFAVGSDKKEKVKKVPGSQDSRRQSRSAQPAVGLGAAMPTTGAHPPQVSRRQFDMAMSTAGTGSAGGADKSMTPAAAGGLCLQRPMLIRPQEDEPLISQRIKARMNDWHEEWVLKQSTKPPLLLQRSTVSLVPRADLERRQTEFSPRLSSASSAAVAAAAAAARVPAAEMKVEEKQEEKKQQETVRDKDKRRKYEEDKEGRNWPKAPEDAAEVNVVRKEEEETKSTRSKKKRGHRARRQLALRRSKAGSEKGGVGERQEG